METLLNGSNYILIIENIGLTGLDMFRFLMELSASSFFSLQGWKLFLQKPNTNKTQLICPKYIFSGLFLV